MTHVELIRRVCDATPTQIIAIENILSNSLLKQDIPKTAISSTYRIKGANGFVFELTDNFASLRTFKNGKPLAAEDCTLRAVTRGYLEILITNAGRFVKRSEIETHIHLRGETESATRISGKTHIYAAFRYTTGQGRKKKYTTLPIYDLIEKVESWDPEYRISAACIEALTPKTTATKHSRQ